MRKTKVAWELKKSQIKAASKDHDFEKKLKIVKKLQKSTLKENKAKAISAELLELNFKDKLKETGKTR